MNSGLKCSSAPRRPPGMFEVMISTTLRKSTVRPWPSVRRPSSITCSRTLKTSGWAFSISSSRTHGVRAAAHGLGQLAALVVADVAGRRADEAADGVLLHVLRHVDADHRVLRVEHELGQRARQLGLADAGRAEEQEVADRAVGVAEPGARAAQGVGDRLDGLVLADDALVQALLHVDELLDLALEQAADRDAGPAGDDLGDVVGVDLLLEEARRAAARRCLGLGELALRARGSRRSAAAAARSRSASRSARSSSRWACSRRSLTAWTSWIASFSACHSAFMAPSCARAGRRARARSPRGARRSRRRSPSPAR